MTGFSSAAGSSDVCPMMIGAAQFWLVRKGFYFTKAGAELPLVWLALLATTRLALLLMAPA